MSGALATNSCKKYRHISTRDTCPLCGLEKETSFHALVTCVYARAMWTQLRSVWNLPDHQLLRDTRREWLLNILMNCNDDMQDCTIMLIWRIWTLKSDMAHGKDVPSPTATADYLQSYMQSLHLARRYSTEDIIKGKMPMLEDESAKPPGTAMQLPWPRPADGHAALSVDGSFSPSDGSAAAGMILRRADGSVIFAAYRCIFNCNDALEAELHAIMQGMALAIQHCNLPIIVQSDFVQALLSLTGESLSRSAYGHLVAEIRLLMGEREFIPLKLKQEQNRVADRLAMYSRTESILLYGLDRGLLALRSFCLLIVTL